MTTIGFVGAGRMGEPMVERLLAAGHEVRVYARRPDLRQRLSAAGAQVVAGPAEAATGVDVFLSCLFSDGQVEEVAPAVLAALPAGAVFCSHTTGSPALLRRLAAEARHRGVDVVDGPVSGTDVDIRASRLTVLLGGEPAAVEACAAAVAAYADPVLRTGALCTALAVKLVNNLLFAAQMQLGAAAVTLAAELGVGQTQLLEALQHCSGGSTALQHLARSGAPVEVFGRRIAEFLGKDVAACEAAAQELEVQPELLLDVARRGPLALAATG